MAMTDMLLAEFDHEMATTTRVLERVPEDKLAWKPHPKSFSLGQLAQHVATIPMWGSMTLQQSELDLAGSDPLPTVTSRADLLGLLDGYAKAARAELAQRTDADLMAPWTLKNGGHTIFTMPKVSVLRSFVLNHLVHHRGQLSLYLRMLDVPVPSIYGPSADESGF
jgi:uncharacterized damage-inducible protein DinB